MLIGLGTVQVLSCLWMLLLSRGFVSPDRLAERPIPGFLALVALQFVVYFAALGVVWNWRPRGGNRLLRPGVLVFSFALLFRAVLWFSHPIQEVDVYRYLWDGRVLAEGINPYRYRPSRAGEGEGSSGEEASGEIGRLKGLRQSTPAIRGIHSRVHFPGVPTVYPPASQLVFLCAALATPADWPVKWQVRMMKLVLLGFDVGAMWLLARLLAGLNLPPGRMLAYGWCPLVLKEVANSGHMDSIGVCLTVASVWLLIRSPGVKQAGGAGTHARVRACLHSGVFALAILAKLYPLVLFPIFARVWWEQLRYRAWLPAAVCLALVMAGMSPVSSGRAVSEAPSGALAGADDESRGHYGGFRAFITEWEINDLLFMVVHENLRARSGEAGGDDAEPWFSILPHGMRAGMRALATAPVRLGRGEPEAGRSAFLAAQVLMGAALGSVCLWLALRRTWKQEPERALLEGVFLSLAWLWFLSAAQNPWYWMWALPFVVFARSRVWFLVPAAAMLYYLRFWLIYHFPDPAPSLLGLGGREFFDHMAVWIEHLPILALLGWSALRRWREATGCRNGAGNPAQEKGPAETG